MTKVGGVMQTVHETVHEVELVYPAEDLRMDRPQVRTKFNISMEKKIEKLWQDSEQQGWDYSKFVTVVMEVLTVLHHRKTLQRTERAAKKPSQRKRALS
ncbi:MAG: hypothetical protein ACLQF2_19740 [Rhodomicrobium sp.]